MYGNCTWLTYRLEMAPGREVSSSLYHWRNIRPQTLTANSLGKTTRLGYHPPLVVCNQHQRQSSKLFDRLPSRESLSDADGTALARVPAISLNFSKPGIMIFLEVVRVSNDVEYDRFIFNLSFFSFCRAISASFSQVVEKLANRGNR